MPLKSLASHIPLLFILIAPHNVVAEEYYWNIQPEAYDWVQKKHPSPELACRALHTDTEYGEYEYNTATPTPDENQWTCNLLYGSDPVEDNIPLSIHRYGKACAQNKSFNALNGQCETQASDKNICVSQTAGNPINFTTGYKIQSEQDFPPSTAVTKNKLKLTKHYNSASGLWTHSFSTRILIDEKTITLVHPNGDRSFFDQEQTDYVARYPATGTISKKSDIWILLSNDASKTKFDSSGRLFDFESRDEKYFVSYKDNHITISDEAGNFIEITEDSKHQPLQLKTMHAEIRYNYNEYKQLISMNSIFQETSKIKEYLYEDEDDSRLLTGIIDERGIRYATWRYDRAGRAISSEHAQGIDRVDIQYHSDESVTVSNALGKGTKYNFGYFQGIKQITSIIGEPTANCPKSNSKFTYDDRGFLASQTDNKGVTTLYTHNDRGLETSRTDASGTAESRMISTEWHATRPLVLRITYPDRSIQYTYDDEGRKIRQTITSQ